MIRDALDLTLSGADAVGAAYYGKALHELQCFVGDPVASVDKAIASAPDFVMAHVMKGYLFGLATEREARHAQAGASEVHVLHGR